MKAVSDPIRLNVSQDLQRGLAWLSVPEESSEDSVVVENLRDFLDKAPAPLRTRHFLLARFWPWVAGLNGILALNALMIWPSSSGIHLLIFLMTMVIAPALLLFWTGIAGLFFGRAPWWRNLLTPHRDRVISLWCCRQALLAQAAFVGFGLVWLWLMLFTRQVIFYWSTSIEWVNRQIDGAFQVLSLGLINPPRALVISASEAGAITGWESSMMTYSAYWAGWLSQVMMLWVILPALVLAAVSHWRLRRSMKRWPEYNADLRRRFQLLQRQAVRFQALEPDQPDVTLMANLQACTQQVLVKPGFVWHQPGFSLPEGSVYLGQGGYSDEQQQVRERGASLRCWYVAINLVPTGDLADLIQLHSQQCDHPELILLVHANAGQGVLTPSLQSWQTFIHRQQLRVQLSVVEPLEPKDD